MYETHLTKIHKDSSEKKVTDFKLPVIGKIKNKINKKYWKIIYVKTKLKNIHCLIPIR